MKRRRRPQGSRAAAAAERISRHYSQLLLRKPQPRKPQPGAAVSSTPCPAAADERAPASAPATSPASEERPAQRLCAGSPPAVLRPPALVAAASERLSSVFEWASPAAPQRRNAGNILGDAAAHNRSAACPLLSLLLRFPDLRARVLAGCSIGALHRLGRVCAALREFSLTYISEAIPRPVVFGGTRGGRWRSADGGSSVPDACCAEELCWGPSVAWQPVPNIYSRLRLSSPGSSADDSDAEAATAAWLGAAAAFGVWPSAACIAAVREYMAQARGCAVSYVQLKSSRLVVIAGGIQPGGSTPIATVLGFDVNSGDQTSLPSLNTPRANFALSVFPPPQRAREQDNVDGAIVLLIPLAAQLLIVAAGGVGRMQEPLCSVEVACLPAIAACNHARAKWVSLPKMRSARVHPSVCCYADVRCGRRWTVLVLGGLSVFGAVLRSTEAVSLSAAAEHGPSADECAQMSLTAGEWAHGPRLNTGRFGAVCTVLWRKGDEGRAVDVTLAGGYNLSRGKLSSAELLDPHAKTGSHTARSQPPKGLGLEGSFLKLPSLAVGRSPWSHVDHCSEGVGGVSKNHGFCIGNDEFCIKS